MNGLKPMLPVRLLLVGEYSDGDPVKAIWELEADRHGLVSKAMRLPEFAANRDEDTLALVNLGIKPAALLKEVVSVTSSKVLYFPPGGTTLASSKVIRYCRQNRVYDAIAGDQAVPEAFERRLKRFRARLERLFAGAAAYDPIQHVDRICSGDACFIATTFEDPDGRVFDEGVEAAMDGLGITSKSPRKEYRLGRKIADKVRDMILESKIIAANIRETDGRFNPNVFYEVGFSEAAGKIIVPCKHLTDRFPSPIDIRDTEYLEYEDAMDLALQLYWGLITKVTDGASG